LLVHFVLQAVPAALQVYRPQDAVLTAQTVLTPSQTCPVTAPITQLFMPVGLHDVPAAAAVRHARAPSHLPSALQSSG
jgi:hypothetical protein